MSEPLDYSHLYQPSHTQNAPQPVAPAIGEDVYANILARNFYNPQAQPVPLLFQVAAQNGVVAKGVLAMFLGLGILVAVCAWITVAYIFISWAASGFDPGFWGAV